MGPHLWLVFLLSFCGLSFSDECQPTLLENVEFSGTDITSVNSPDANHCQQLCTQHPSCLFFTFVRPDSTTDDRHFFCYLRQTSDGEPTTQPSLLGVTSGYSLKPCTPNPACRPNLLENIDFPGSDIGTVKATNVIHCQQLCTQHPTCLFFTFTRADWTRNNRRLVCFLKRSSSGEPMRERRLQGLTSGYSLKPCTSIPDQCFSEVYDNVDFLGADYRVLFTADYEECQRACTQDLGCQFFTFAKADFSVARVRYKCFLKFSWTVPQTPTVEELTGVVSGFSHKLKIIQNYGPECEAKLFPDTNIPSNDLVSMASVSADHCHTLCSADPRCTYFSFSGNTCSLKKNVNRMVTVAEEGVKSGVPSRFCQPDDDWVKMPLEGIGFSGSDIRYVEVDDAEACQRACTEEPNCQFYTYNTDAFSEPNDRGRCYLKRVISIPAPPKVNKLNGVVSGFTLRNCAVVDGLSLSQLLTGNSQLLSDFFASSSQG